MGVYVLMESYIFPFMFVEINIKACPYPRDFKVNERSKYRCIILNDTIQREYMIFHAIYQQTWVIVM